MRLLLVIVAIASVVACSGTPAPTASPLDAHAEALAFFADRGFSELEQRGSDSIWSAHRPDRSASAEVIGAAPRLDQVTLTVQLDLESRQLDEDGGQLVAEFLDHFVPGSTDFRDQVLAAAYRGSEIDRHETVAGLQVGALTWIYTYRALSICVLWAEAWVAGACWAPTSST